MSMRLVVSFLLVLLLAACGKKTEGGVQLEQVSSALKGAGFPLDNFQRIDGSRYGANSCATGPIGGVDTLVCEYASGASAQSLKAAEQWVGDAVTGSVLVNGKTLLAVADRGHADRNGKVIHKITQTYRALK